MTLTRTHRTILYPIFLFCLMLPSLAMSQVNVDVVVTQVSTTIGDCDGTFSGDSDPAWWWTGGDVDDQCVETTCNGCTIGTSQSLLDESYDCPNDMPGSININFNGCENDFLGCTLGAFLGACDGNSASLTTNLGLPTTNGTTNLGPFCANSTGCSGQWCYWLTVTRTGSFISNGNDVACDAINLGTLGFGGSLGNENNAIYNNLCGTGDSQPADWNSSQGVWFSFQTGSQVGTSLTFEFEPSGGPVPLFGDLDIQASIFEASPNCNSLVEVADGVDVIDVTYDETIVFDCPQANTTYYILVDGSSIVPLFSDEEGYFGLGIYDDGIVQAADFICEAEYLGTPSPGNPVTTNATLQSNVCATQAISPSGNDPLPGSDWSTDADQQQGVWFQFTAPASGSVLIDIESTADILNIFDPNDINVQVALYETSNNTCSGNLQLIDEQQSDLTPCGFISIPVNDFFDEDFKVRCLTPGQDYWIFVDGDDSASLPNTNPFGIDGVAGYFSITVSDLQQPAAPNDDICDAIFLGAPQPNGGPIVLNNQSNHCATPFFEVNNFGWTNEQGVWYSFIAPSSGAVEIWAENQFLYTCVPAVVPIPVYEDGIQIELAVFHAPNGITCSGTPATNQNDEVLDLILAENEEINDLIDGGIGPLDVVNDEYIFVECLIPGETYYILVDGFPSLLGTVNTDLQEGVFDITIEAVDQTAPTGNNLPCDAIALGDPTSGSVGGSTTYNNYCADADGEPDVIGFDTEQTVWFTFEAPSTGSVNVDVNENGDDINLQVAVFAAQTDCSGNMIEIASNDDFFTWDVEIDEVHCLNPGETYYVMVDGEHDPTALLGWQEGEFTIEISEIPTLPNLSLNNFICDATAIGDPFSPGLGTTLTLANENNLCANNLNDPIPAAFDPDYTVWYTITTPNTPGTYAVDIFAESDFWSILDPFNFSFDAIDLQLALYESSDGTCNGSLTELGSSYTAVIDYPLSLGFDQDLTVECLEPNTTYYLMVDGAVTFAGDIGTGQGNFDISVTSIATNPAAPNNDICEFTDLGTVPVNGSIPPNTNYYNFCADTEMGEPDPFGLDQTVWFTFNAPNTPGANASSSVTISLESDPNNLGDEINLQVAVYESDGGCTGNLTLLDYEFDGILYGEDLSLTCLDPGGQYFMQIDGADNLIGGIEGYFTIEITDDGGGQFPTNDDICATAYPLGTVPNGGSINPGTTFSNVCATIQAGEPDPGFGLGTDDIDQTVWFTFSPSNSGNVLIDAESQGSDNVDLQLAVYYSADGSCDPTQMVPINHEWDGAGLLWDESLLITCLDPNVTYYLQVDGSSITEDLQSGNFTLELTDDGGSTTVPYNNDICDAYDFGDVGAVEGLTNETNVCADVEPGEPGVFLFAQHTVWYQFTAPASGRIEIEIDPISILDLFPEVHLYSSSSGDCTGTLTEIESDIVPDISGNAFIATPCLVPGQTYFIQVDGQVIAPQGDFNITLTNPEPNYGSGLAGDPEPSNNECIDAIPITVQDESCFIGDGIFQTENYGEPTISLNDAYVQGCNANGNCGDTWYCFTMPNSGAALVEGNDDNSNLFTSSNDLTIIAYEGDCNGLNPIECASGDEMTFEVGAAPGTKIYLQVFDGGLDFPNENFQLCVSEQCGADNCLNAIVMENQVAYCFNTASATGEDLSIEPGYGECGTGSGGDANPEHSVYFTFTSDCNGGSITLDIFNVTYDENDPNYQPCSGGLFNFPTDGFTVTIFADDTPCDNNFDDVVWCNVVDGCSEAIGYDSYSQTFDDLIANTNYIIMIDGGIYNLFNGELGGNVEGEIMITTLTNPDIDTMIVVDSIDCFGETGTLTAEVSGGLYPYSYNWDNVSTDSIYTNVGPGWHYVTVSADNGCEEVDSIFLPEPPELLADATFDPSTICAGNNNQASTSVNGGSPNYSYVWSNGETTANATMLAPGNTYTVTITDDNGCTTTDEVTLPPVSINFIR